MPEGILRYLKTLAAKARNVNSARQKEFLFAHLGILAILGVIALAVLLSAHILPQTGLGIGITLALALVGAILASLSFLASGFAAQHVRDLTALRIFGRVIRGGSVPAYSILIRPFSGEDIVSHQSFAESPFGKNLQQGPTYSGPEHPLSFELDLAKQVKLITGPLICLGAPTLGAGAGRTPVSARDWDEAAGELADRANLIFFVPGIDESSKNDLEELLDSSIIRRTILVEPGIADEDNANDVEADTMVIRWNSLRSIFAAHGYVLPAKSAKGALIYLWGLRIISARCSLRRI